MLITNQRQKNCLISVCDIFDLHCLINQPTRITPISETLIDLILTNNKKRILSSGTIEPHISDHQLVYTVMRAKSSFKRSRKITCRSFKNYNKDKFEFELSSVPFSISSIFDDPDDKVWVFQKLLSDVINDHAPLKTFHIRGGHVPYMNPTWRESIRYRNNLWNKYRKSPTPENWAAYKKQRNITASMRRKSISNYFSYTVNPLLSPPSQISPLPLISPPFSGEES